MRASWRTAWWFWLRISRSSLLRWPKAPCPPSACASASSSWSAISFLSATAWWRRSTRSAGRRPRVHHCQPLTTRGKTMVPLVHFILSGITCVHKTLENRGRFGNWVVPWKINRFLSSDPFRISWSIILVYLMKPYKIWRDAVKCFRFVWFDVFSCEIPVDWWTGSRGLWGS